MKRFSRKIACLLVVAFLLNIGVVAYLYKSSDAKNKSIIPSSIKVTVGKTKKISVKNSKIRNKIKWSSDNKKIAIVSKNGVVSGKKAGKTKITAKYKNIKYTCKVEVVKAKKQETDKKPSVTAAPEPTVTPTERPYFEIFIPESKEDKGPVETRKPVQANVDSDWEEAKVSGSLEAYKKYFETDMDLYLEDDVPHGTVSKIEYPSKVYDMDREAYVYLPPNYDKEKTYPVVYMIHGIGCDCGQWVSMNAADILDNLYQRGEAAPVIAVFPSVIPADGIDKTTLSQTNIQAFTDFEAEFIYDLEPYIRENYAVSLNRKYTAICGLSMGGMEALCTGFTLKGHFNYIGSFSAAPTLDKSLLKIENPEDTPELVMLCSGDADGTVGDNPRDYHLELTKNGVDHIWYQYPGGGHSPEVWRNGLVNFMKRIF